MLPREAYVDPAVLAWEHANFFTGWVCVGRADDLDEAGSQTAVSLGGAGVLLTRAEDGALHAFANVCRHRGHELLPCGSSASKRGIVCPYHAWSYRLDGSLLAAPGFRDVEGFEPDQFGLIELPVDRLARLGLRRHLTASPVTSPSTSARSRTSSRPTRRQSCASLATHEYEIAANWKIIVENYQECYHCSMIHPELCSVSPPESGANLDLPGDWVGGWMALRDEADTMSLDGKSAGVVIDGLDATEQRTVMYIAMFPNLLISLHPDYVMTHRLTPLAADRTFVECAWLFPEAVAAARGLRPVLRGGLLGHHQPPGLERLRVGAARPVQRARRARAAGPGGGRRAALRGAHRPWLHRSARARPEDAPALDVGRHDPRRADLVGRAGERVAVEHGEVREQPDLEATGHVVEVVHVGAALGVGAAARSPRSMRLRG